MALPTPLAIERAGLRCWPGIEVEWDRAWVRRAAGGHTQRANSVQCFDPADDGDVAQRLESSRRWFEDRGIRPTVRATPLTGPNQLAELNQRGWIGTGHSRLMAMELAPSSADDHAELLGVEDPAFLTAQVELKNWDDVTLGKFRALIAMFDVPAVGIVLRGADGRAVSSALMAVADGIVITGNVVTSTAERRKGYAVRMMRTGFAWAHGEGARVAALNVEAGNVAGLALYGALGYVRQYDYCYYVPGSQ